MKNIFFGLACFLPLVIKLFTVEIWLKEEPTSGVALRGIPSLASFEARSLEEFDKSMFLLGPDENAYLGSKLYRPLVRWFWPLLPALWLLTWLVRR